MDTFQEDLWYLANLAGVTNVLNMTHKGQGELRINTSKIKLSEAERTKKYFDMLDQERKLNLLSMYEFDFQLFDYHPEPYM